MITGKPTVTIDESFVRGRMVAAFNAGLTLAAISAASSIKASFSKNGKYRPSNQGYPPNRNSGLLYNAISSTKGENLSASVYTSGVAYARIQEFGGIIKAKSSKYLTIPLNDQAARMRERTSTLRSLNLTFVPGKHRGVAFLAQTKGRGKNAKSTLMFMLKPTVRLPARPYLRPAFQSHEVVAKMLAAFCRGARKALTEGISA
jgi:phage gpG-like protein